VLGGRLRLQGSAVALTRDQSQYIAGDPGVDSRRASGVADWRGNLTTSYGLRISPFAQARLDAYSLADLPGGQADASVTRALGVIGADFSMPFIRRDGDRTIVLEPLAQVALSPQTKVDTRIPNEDSIDFEFDETNLFRADKSPGFDLYEGGQRLNLGVRATVAFDDGRDASLLVGRSYRNQADPALPARTGLQRTASDWIVAAAVRPLDGVSLFTRARLDGDSLDVHRIEAGADVETSRAWGYVRYLRDDQDISGVPRQDLDFSGKLLVVGNWGVTFGGIRDIENNVWRRQELGILYKDDCLDAAVVWVHEETFNRTLGPSDSVVLRLTLATLGDKGYSQ
jgi:LPS-assembly protein